jgi:hypothetical protein
MTVRAVRIEEMPRAKDADGNKVRKIPDLYDDLLIRLFQQNLERANEYLDEVRPSGWDIAPETPSDFEELLSDHPYTKEFDDRKRDEGGTARPEFNDWPDNMLEFAKAIESEFGVEGDKFTYDDLTEVNGIPYSDDSIRAKFPEFVDEGFARDSGDRRNQSKLWVWVKSWNKDNSQQDPVADGGVNEYNWSEAIQRMEEGNVVRDDKRDWFTSKNLPAFIDIYESISEVSDAIEELRESRLFLEYHNLEGEIPKWKEEDLEEQINELKNSFQEVFSRLHGLVDTAHNRVTVWAEKYEVDLHNELDRNRPHKKQDRQLQRLEAKRFAVIDTYLTPLLTYPSHLADTRKLEDVENVVDAFMMWLWVMYENLSTYITIDGSADDEVPIEDTVKDVLDIERKATSGEDHVEWPKLVKVVQHDHPDSPGPKLILQALKELHRLGQYENSVDWRGLHLDEVAESDEEPRFTVEIAYDRFDTVDCNISKWRGDMLRQVEE